jgi:phosphohistidine swiveling domain-containing protein
MTDGLDRIDETVAQRLASVLVDPRDVGRVVGAIEHVGWHLAAKGPLRTPDAIWAQTLEWVEQALTTTSPRPAARRVGDRWGHLVYGVAVVHGHATEGTPASDGSGAGRACFVSAPDDVRAFRSGDVLVVNRPIPKLAPLLWEASALVCRNGNPAAHLCEVARSLHVPAVVSADLPDAVGEWMAAVDGGNGRVHWWATDATAPSSGAVGARVELEGSLR